MLLAWEGRYCFNREHVYAYVVSGDDEDEDGGQIQDVWDTVFAKLSLAKC